jgi:hypothetical protein
MFRRQVRSALLLSTLLALAAATGAIAKDDAIVTLDASLPSDPEPGSQITIGWTVEVAGESGEMVPFNAEAMFIRLIPASGDPVEALGRQGPPGHYVATMTVPDGGIRDVEAGLRGESCSGGTCQRSDILFAIDESAIPAIEPGAAANAPGAPANVPRGASGAPGAATTPEAPAATTAPVGPVGDIEPVGLVGLAVAAVVALAAILAVRARGRALSPGSSRS